MKIAKRVLVGMLAIAMLVTGLFVYSFATDDSVEEPSIPDYADVLKFYDPLYSKLYADEDFEDGVYGGSVLLMENARRYTAVGVEAPDTNSYLALTLGHVLNPDARTDAAYSIDFDGETLSKVVFGAKISATHSDMSGKICASASCSYTTDVLATTVCPRCSSELVTVSSKAPTIVFSISENATVGARLLTFNFATGKVSYNDGAASEVYIEGLTASEGKWYDVHLVCDTTQYKFVISDGTSTYEASAINSPVYNIKNVSVGARYIDDARGATVMVDDVFVQAGIDDRNRGVDLLAETNEGLLLIKQLLQDETIAAEIKADVIAVYDTLTGVYGDVLVTDSESDAHMSDIRLAMLDFFRSQLKLATDSIDVTASYTVRLTLIENNATYAERIRELLRVEDDADSAAVLATYDDEKVTLEHLKDNSEDFIAYIADNISNNAAVFTSEDYVVLKEFVDDTEAIYLSEGKPIYDSTYPPIKDALASYTVTATRYRSYLEKSTLFCGYVAEAKLAEDDLNKPEADRTLTSEQFVACLAAYENASELGFSNDTFPGMADALSTFAAMSKLSEISVVAERFINNVETAEQAKYLFMKEQWLDSAEPDYALADNRYTGVSDAKAKYDALRQQIAEKKAAADAYIAAVDQIEGKTGDELIAAIETALALRDSGNVPGYDGITEANIALDTAHKSRQLELAYASKFITLVNAIEDAETLEERFVAIGLADNARGFALDSIDGVTAANAKLVAAVSLYNADIAAINNSYDSVASNAGDIASAATSLTDIIKLVASAIKSIAG